MEDASHARTHEPVAVSVAEDAPLCWEIFLADADAALFILTTPPPWDRSIFSLFAVFLLSFSCLPSAVSRKFPLHGVGDAFTLGVTMRPSTNTQRASLNATGWELTTSLLPVEQQAQYLAAAFHPEFALLWRMTTADAFP